MRVTKETLIGEVIDYDMDAAQCFFEMGMFCIGCPHSRGESLEEACMVHGVNTEELIENLNKYFENKENK